MPWLDPEKRRAYRRAYHPRNLEKLTAAYKEWHKQNKEHVKAYRKRTYKYDPVDKRDRTLRMRYGITTREYQALLDFQGGTCALCSKKPRKRANGQFPMLDVDHCHKTGKIRGLLCSGCNIGLGQFEDNSAHLEKAIDYLNWPPWMILSNFTRQCKK